MYFRTLLVTYAFLVFLGVMPKPPERTPYQSALEFMVLTVTTSASAFIALAVVVALVGMIGAVLASALGLKRPAQPVPHEASNGRPL